MPKYITKQRKLLTEYLSRHTDESLSANRIAEALCDKISKSAVYRNLSDMESEGKLRRVAANGSREVIYQYVDEEKCHDCLHLSCKKCGKTYHMNCAVAENIIKDISDNELFDIDKEKTVLYGICKDCKE